MSTDDFEPQVQKFGKSTWKGEVGVKMPKVTSNFLRKGASQTHEIGGSQIS